MKRSLFFFGFLASIISLTSCQKELSHKTTTTSTTTTERAGAAALNVAAECGTPMVKNLYDMGGVTNWGTIEVSNDNTNIIVKITSSTYPNMLITRTSLVYGSESHVQTAITNQFNWTPCEGPSLPDRVKTTPAPGLTTDTIHIPLSALQSDNCLWLGVYVMLQDPVTYQLGCAYADPYTQIFGSAQWQSAFTYCKQDCPPPPPGDCGQLRTQTPGGWGAPPSGQNPGAYLHANFASAFPNGLTVGCYPGDYYVKLTSAQAITNLLPTGGQAAVLKANYTDPASMKNVLVGHLVALTLSTGFDVYDPSFGQAGIHLGDMVIGSGTFKGWTVSQFLVEADKVLGGCSTSYTVQQVLETADNINQNYTDGTTDKKYLVCPNQ